MWIFVLAYSDYSATLTSHLILNRHQRYNDLPDLPLYDVLYFLSATSSNPSNMRWWLPPKLSLEFSYAVWHWCFWCYVRQNVAVVVVFFLSLYLIIRYELCLCRSVWCYAKLRWCSDTHGYVTWCHLCANLGYIGCQNKGFFSFVVGKI